MDVRTAFFGLLLVALGTIAALLVAPLLQYVLAAGLLAFVLYPAQVRLEERVPERLAAIVLTALAVAGAVVPILYFSVVILQSVFGYLDSFDELAAIEALREAAFEAGIEEDVLASIEAELLAEIENTLGNAVELVLMELVRLLNASIRMSVGLLVLVFVLYYMLVDGDAFIDWIEAVVPISDEVRDELFAEIEVVTWAVIRSHVLVALVEGLLGGLGFYLLGLPNVAFWTVVMIVASFLPAVGVWLIWGPAVLYLATTGTLLEAAVLFLYGITALSLVDNYLRAIFVDRGSGLHPAVVLVGVIGGIYLLGIMGLFLGPVLLAVFKAGVTVFSRVNGYGEDPTGRPGSRRGGRRLDGTAEGESGAGTGAGTGSGTGASAGE
ncbi:Predicted PurR-regulated permease PerM [Halobiforma haloterrestris]|uniref:Predicted PurR-regulated permease PerM n=1 Tax=Natronobacterium haloterrestre TaxID=148448 RepID=A0A1I1JA04_NATHA|nr:AI-2E family transporter [Halobiforma haloterrestris]SFC42270.1 Predicted PurR-regulated permease PerM [Halobiforma haloterrestris]